ncbi:protein containing LysR, substrate-binding domain protein, partial [gut metagenome]
DYRLIERVPLVVALHGSHPFAQRKALRREELKGETLLYMSPSGTGYSTGDDYFLELYRKAGYQPNILLRSNDIESILMMVAAEVGISVLPGYCANRMDSAENLVFVPLLGEEETEEILAFWHRDDPSQPLAHFVAQL